MKRRRWTAEEDSILRSLWSEHRPLAEIGAALGRPVASVYPRAVLLGLPNGKPEGAEYVRESAKRCGFSYGGMLSVLRAHGVPLRRSQGLSNPRYWVLPKEADEAVAARCALETPETASARLGISAARLRLWLREAGDVPKRGGTWLLPSSTFDAVVAARGHGTGGAK